MSAKFVALLDLQLSRGDATHLLPLEVPFSALLNSCQLYSFADLFTLRCRKRACGFALVPRTAPGLIWTTSPKVRSSGIYDFPLDIKTVFTYLWRCIGQNKTYFIFGPSFRREWDSSTVVKSPVDAQTYYSVVFSANSAGNYQYPQPHHKLYSL